MLIGALAKAPMLIGALAKARVVFHRTLAKALMLSEGSYAPLFVLSQGRSVARMAGALW
jgi:hypothetical protein